MARTREFDPTEALDKATRLFWEKGYEGTSIQDLVDVTGVNRASLYHVFGGKREIFEKALHRFQGDPALDLRHASARFQPGMDRIRAGLRVVAGQTLQEPRGCLLINSVIELAMSDETMCSQGLQVRLNLEAFFAECLKEASARGELRPGQNLRALARFLTNTVLGLRLLAKMRPDRKLVDDIVSTTLSTL